MNYVTPIRGRRELAPAIVELNRWHTQPWKSCGALKSWLTSSVCLSRRSISGEIGSTDRPGGRWVGTSATSGEAPVPDRSWPAAAPLELVGRLACGGPTSRATHRLRLARPAPLLRNTADSQWCRGQDGPARTRSQHADDHLEHLRARVAGCSRSDADACGHGARIAPLDGCRRGWSMMASCAPVVPVAVNNAVNAGQGRVPRYSFRLLMYWTTPSGTRYQTGWPRPTRCRQSVEEIAMAGTSTRLTA